MAEIEVREMREIAAEFGDAAVVGEGVSVLWRFQDLMVCVSQARKLHPSSNLYRSFIISSHLRRTLKLALELLSEQSCSTLEVTRHNLGRSIR